MLLEQMNWFDLKQFTSIQSLGDNLTRAEFAQQDFIKET